MKSALSQELAARVSDRVSARLGLRFDSVIDFQRGLRRAARAFGFGEDLEACGEWLLNEPLDRRQLEVLASSLTVGETYFFRDSACFLVLADEVLSPLIRLRRESGNRNLRIWSAGCATGEEPYSIAILLHQLLEDNIGEWVITILATDINTGFLHTAAEAVYGQWSFRNEPAGLRAKWFRADAGNRKAWRLRGEVVRTVTFGYHNLAEDPYPAIASNTNAMDLIVCRNVLMYFREDVQRRVIEKFHACLLPGGWLVTGAAEPFAGWKTPFATLHMSGPGVFRKEPAPTPAASEGPAESVALLKKEAPEEPAAGQVAEEPGGGVDGSELAALSRAFADKGDLRNARQLIERAIAVDKTNPCYHYLLAAILQEMGQFDNARLCLKRTLYIDPNFVLAHVALANLARRGENRAEADHHLENAVAILSLCRPDDIVPESGGLSAGTMIDIIRSTRPDHQKE